MQRQENLGAMFCSGTGTTDGELTHFSKMLQEASNKNPLNSVLNLEKVATVESVPIVYITSSNSLHKLLYACVFSVRYLL